MGNISVLDVTQARVQAIAEKLKPNCMPGTVNRHIFTPILAVLNYVADLKLCPPPVLTRPKGHGKAPALVIPDEAWFRVVLPRLSLTKRAAVLLITLHGLRVSEAIEREPSDLNMRRIDAMKAVFAEHDDTNAARAKTGKPPKEMKWLFGTNNRRNFHRDIQKACEQAQVRGFGSYAIGRHSFATRALQDGKSLKFLKDAGRWKTIAMPAQRYGHLERSEVDEAVIAMANKWPAEVSEPKDEGKAVEIVKEHQAKKA